MSFHVNICGFINLPLSFAVTVDDHTQSPQVLLCDGVTTVTDENKHRFVEFLERWKLYEGRVAHQMPTQGQHVCQGMRSSKTTG